MCKLRVLLAMSVLMAGCGSLLAQAPTPPIEGQPQNVLKIKTKSNIKNDRTVAPPVATAPVAAHPKVTPEEAAKIKSHSNQANNREAQPAPATGAGGVPRPVDAAKIKSHSNQTNNRVAQTKPDAAAEAVPKSVAKPQ
jgi:hypothetical protein